MGKRYPSRGCVKGGSGVWIPTASGPSGRFWKAKGCPTGSIQFDHRGLSYHIWEYPPEEPGAQSNVRSAGRTEDFGPDYEREILEILKTW